MIDDILAAITPVVETLEQLGVDYHIGGSVASSAYGFARSTLDADLVADLQLQHVDVLADLLRTEYYLNEEAIREAIERRSSFNLIHLETMLKVDIFIPKGQSFDMMSAQRTQSVSLDKTTPRTYRLASPEDVVLHKLTWYKAGGGVSERQWGDVLGVLKVQARALDLSYLKLWATKLEVADLLSRAFEDAGL